MTAKVQLYNQEGQSLTSVDFWVEKFKRVSRNQEPVLEVTDVIRRHGVFNSVTRTTAGTTTVATPDTSGSLLITDIMISGEKQASSTVELLFTDGSQTESLFLVSQVDVPAQFALPVAGRIQGWKDARLDMTTTGSADATVTIGYVKVPTSLNYEEWDAYR